jgi:hypothetical protein
MTTTGYDRPSPLPGVAVAPGLTVAHGELGWGPNASGRWCGGCRGYHGAAYLCHHFAGHPAIVARINAAGLDTAGLVRGRRAA